MTMTVRVLGIDRIEDLANDLRGIAARCDTDVARVVRAVAHEGNEIARGFASQQHTMGTAIDVPYQESFSAEENGPMEWEYGPVDDGIPHGGSQAVGYEHGSRNQPPHLDLARSADIIGPKLADDVGDLIDGWFW